MRRGVLLGFGSALLLSLGVYAQAGRNPDPVATMKRAPVTGGELEYEVRGEGEPVLLIHGALVAGSFVPVMNEPALASYRLIRYHRRGYRGSTAPPDKSNAVQAADAVALLRHLGIERAHIVGHSSGGQIALQLTLDTPAVVHSLTVLEPSGIGPVPGESELVKQVMEPANARFREGDAAGAVDLFMRGVAGPNWRTQIARTVPGGPEQAEKDAAAYFGVPSSAGPHHLDRKQVGSIAQPVLFMWGTETFAAVKQGRVLFHRWLPGAEDHVIQGVGHSLQMENPRAVTEAIGDFLKRHPIREHVQRIGTPSTDALDAKTAAAFRMRSSGGIFGG